MTFLHLKANQAMWTSHHQVSLVWTFFQLKNNKQVDASKAKTMRCVLCHPTVLNESISTSNHRTRAKKGIVVYNATHSSTSLRKHVDHAHP